MNKKITARALSRVLGRSVDYTESMLPLPGQLDADAFLHSELGRVVPLGPNGHVNVGTIGPSLAQELVQPTLCRVFPQNGLEHQPNECAPDPSAHAILDRALREVCAVDVVAKTDFAWQDNQQGHAKMMNQWFEFLKDNPVEEHTCRVPEELRERFMAEGFTSDEVDRMVIYPDRCKFTLPEIQIVYKMDPKSDGMS